MHPGYCDQGPELVKALYTRAMFTFGLEGGGSVGHTAGVIAALAQRVQLRVLSNDALPAVELPVEVLPPKATQQGGLAELAYNRAFAQRLAHCIEAELPDFVYHRFTDLNAAVAAVCARMGTPLVLEFNSSPAWTLKHWQKERRSSVTRQARLWLAMANERFNLSHAALVTVVSSPLAHHVVAQGVDPRRVLVNPNGVDAQRFAPPSEVSREATRRSLALDPEHVVVGFSGTFGPWHGSEHLEAAIERLLPRPRGSVPLRFVMIGDGGRRAAMQQALRKFAEVSFVGMVAYARMPEILGACDILVSPHGYPPDGSVFFGSPTKLFEYMATGRAVVASRLGQQGEVIEHERTGLLTPPSDPEALAAALDRLASDAALRSRLGQAARQRALTHHTWARNCERLLEAFDSVRSLGPPRGGLRIEASAEIREVVTRPIAPARTERSARAVQLPRKLAGRISRPIRTRVAASVAVRSSAYGRHTPGLSPSPVSRKRLASLPARMQDLHRRGVQDMLAHSIDLLGSGAVQIKHGMLPGGLEHSCYPPAQCPQIDAEGQWLHRALHPRHAERAVSLWQLVTPGYVPFDWQLDYRSGYRWSERTYYRRIRYGSEPGADIKLPWELSRMQHLPRLALACAYGLGDSNTLQLEIQNQWLDFMAQNPPGFGANWACTMDVAIRAANWVLAYWLLRASDAALPPAVERMLATSLYDHAEHIVRNLEWSPTVTSNHYLADICGLAFVAAALAPDPRIDSWLSFALSQLLHEIETQFHPDGSNFEASVAYHALCSEMVAFSIALAHALPSGRLEQLPRGASLQLPEAPRAALERSRSRPLVLPGGRLELSASIMRRLRGMSTFLRAATRPDGRIAQFGDNDSGRFVALLPFDPEQRLGPHPLSRAPILRALDALLHAHVDPDEDAGEAALICALTGSEPLDAQAAKTAAPDAAGGAASFEAFGLHIMRNEHVYLALRAGPNGQAGNGGHAHNDQLSFELCIDGMPVIVDPGTYLYTPHASLRNHFRSTVSHNALHPAGQEQNPIGRRPADLFRLQDTAHGGVVQFGPQGGVFEHVGHGCVARRQVELGPLHIRFRDQLPVDGDKELRLHLHPGIFVQRDGDPRMATLQHDNRVLARLVASHPVSIQPYRYSEGYGLVRPSHCLLLATADCEVELNFELSQ